MHRPGILSTIAITAVILSTFISERDAMAATGGKEDVENKPAPERLNRRLELVLERLKHKQALLARPGPSEKAWAVGHVGLTLARGVAGSRGSKRGSSREIHRGAVGRRVVREAPRRQHGQGKTHARRGCVGGNGAGTPVHGQ